MLQNQNTILNQTQPSSSSIAVMPYTFTTGELDSLSGKLQIAEQQISSLREKNVQSIIPLSLNELRALQKMVEMTYLQGLSNSTTLPMQRDTRSVMMKSNGTTSTPPNNYICHKCGIQGHYVYDCPNVIDKGPPPNNYVCHKCNIQGHWIQECPLGNQQDYGKPPPPNYCCHRCGVPGHWIKNCPTNQDSLENPTRSQNNNINTNQKNMDTSNYGQQWASTQSNKDNKERVSNSRTMSSQGGTYVKKKRHVDEM